MRYNSIIEYVKLAAPEDHPLGSKHVVLHTVTCISSGTPTCHVSG
jgi:hypothetical protein